jgi:hypothetical protein
MISFRGDAVVSHRHDPPGVTGVELFLGTGRGTAVDHENVSHSPPSMLTQRMESLRGDEEPLRVGGPVIGAVAPPAVLSSATLFRTDLPAPGDFPPCRHAPDDYEVRKL